MTGLRTITKYYRYITYYKVLSKKNIEKNKKRWEEFREKGNLLRLEKVRSEKLRPRSPLVLSVVNCVFKTANFAER